MGHWPRACRMIGPTALHVRSPAVSSTPLRRKGLSPQWVRKIISAMRKNRPCSAGMPLLLGEGRRFYQEMARMRIKSGNACRSYGISSELAFSYFLPGAIRSAGTIIQRPLWLFMRCKATQ
jgi:hypothetical protein